MNQNKFAKALMVQMVRAHEIHADLQKAIHALKLPAGYYTVVHEGREYIVKVWDCGFPPEVKGEVVA